MLILSYLFYCLSSFGCFHVQPNKWQTFKVGWTKATVNTPTAKPAPPVCWPRTNDEAAPTYGSCRTVLATTNEWYGSICVCCCVGTVLLLLMLRCDGFFGVLVVLVLLCFVFLQQLYSRHVVAFRYGKRPKNAHVQIHERYN